MDDYVIQLTLWFDIYASITFYILCTISIHHKNFIICISYKLYYTNYMLPGVTPEPGRKNKTWMVISNN